MRGEGPTKEQAQSEHSPDKQPLPETIAAKAEITTDSPSQLDSAHEDAGREGVTEEEPPHEDYELSAYSPFRVRGAAALLTLANEQVVGAKQG